MSAVCPNKWTGMMALVDAGAFQLTRIQGVGGLVDIDKNRLCTGEADRLGGGHERAWDGDHFIARSDTKRQQREPQCIRAVANSDGLWALAEGGELFLKLGHKGPTREGAGIKAQRSLRQFPGEGSHCDFRSRNGTFMLLNSGLWFSRAKLFHRQWTASDVPRCFARNEWRDAAGDGSRLERDLRRVQISQDACRISGDHCAVGDILGNHHAGADDGAFTNGHSSQNSGVGPDGGAFFDARLDTFPIRFGLRAAIIVCQTTGTGR